MIRKRKEKKRCFKNEGNQKNLESHDGGKKKKNEMMSNDIKTMKHD
jgi:hypothetical protein